MLVFACLTWLVLGRLVGRTCTCLLTIEPGVCWPALGGAAALGWGAAPLAAWLPGLRTPLPALAATPPPVAPAAGWAWACPLTGRGGCISEGNSPAPPAPPPPVEEAGAAALAADEAVAAAEAAVVTWGAISCCGDRGYFRYAEWSDSREKEREIGRVASSWGQHLRRA